MNYSLQIRLLALLLSTKSPEAFHGFSIGTFLTGTSDVGLVPSRTAGAILAGQLTADKIMKINSELAMQKAIGEVVIKNPATRSVVEAFIAARTIGMQFAIPFSYFRIFYHMETLIMGAITIPICLYQFFRERTKSYTGERFFSKRRPQISKLDYYRLECIDVEYMEIYENSHLGLQVVDSKGSDKTN